MSSILASCSTIVLTHSLDSPNPVSRISPHDSKVNCVTWNHNNKVLASAGEDQKIVLFHSENVERLTQLPVEDGRVQSVAFSSKSELLASGESSGAVRIWDLRKKAVKHLFNDHSEAVTQVAWNSLDSQLASASLSGEIILHSLLTGISIANFKQKNSSGIKLIQFSPFKKQVLAAASENGSVYVWDCNTRSVTCSFQNYHHSPVTGLGFSAVNPMLMCTSGLDQRIQFYDISERKVVKTLETDAPLTCMSFFHDGHTIAAGTLYGTVQIYDLRVSSNTKIILRGHEGTSVNWVEFTKNSPKDQTPPMFTTVTQKDAPQAFPGKPAEEARPPIAKFRSIEEIKQQAKLRVEMNRREKMKEDVKNQPAVSASFEVATEEHKAPSVSSSLNLPAVENEETSVKVQETNEIVRPEEARRINVIEQRLDRQEEAILGLRDDLQNLHIELIRQFTIQQNEIRDLFEEYSIANSNLLREYNELREENMRLKHTTY